MHIDFQYASLGMYFAAIMYVVGNGIWVNHLVRGRIWLGWLLWGASALILLFAGAAIEGRLSGESLQAVLAAASSEKHWIIVMLYALLSFPGAACVLFRQERSWTRLALSLTALIVFIPLGSQLHDPENPRLMMSLGIAVSVCALMWLWSALVDADPEHRRRTIPVEEMNA